MTARSKNEAFGQRMTSQRKLLIEIIRDTGHMDADELYRRAKERDPRISLSTIYRNLNLLKELGLISELHLGEGPHHYEMNVLPEHHHLICRQCGEVFEFQSPLIEDLKHKVENASQFEVTHIEVNLQGICSNCQTERLGNG